MKAGDELDFKYRLYWSAMPPVRSPLANVFATRTGMGGFPEGWAPGKITRKCGPVALLSTSSVAT